MPDSFNNPGGPGRDAAIPSVQETLNYLRDLTASSPDIKVLAALLQSVRDIAAQTDKTFSDTAKNLDQMGTRIRNWGSELKRVVSLSDDIEENTKAIFEYQHKMMREGMKVRSVKEFSDILTEMKKKSEAMIESGVFSKQHRQLFDRNIRQMGIELDNLKSKIGDALDPDAAEDLLVRVSKINKVTIDLARNLKNVKLSHFGKEMVGAERAIGHLLSPFGIATNQRLDKIHKYAQVGHDIRVARQKKDAGRHEEFRKMRDDLLERVRPIIRNPDSFRRNGTGAVEIDNKAVRSRTRAEVSALTSGMNPFAAAFIARSAAAEAVGAKPSFFTRAGSGLAAHVMDQGSLTRGLVSWGAGSLEGGAGSLAALAGEIAPLIAFLDMTKAAFNKNQKMNAEVAEQLAGGAIFGGGNDAITALSNARQNLMPTSIYSRLGIGYEKNLKLAQAVQEGGFGLQNLSDSRVGHSQGFLQNSFGTFERNAYVYGKMAGLSPSQTVAETIKLITQYRQSLGATEDFFVNIRHDTRAAGISTMKYIQILDDVNSHYDRSNKLLTTTISIMANLSKTGRDTADDLKDAMDAVTNGGQQQPLERAAFLDIQAMKSPQERQRLLALRQYNFNNAAQKAAAALGITDTATTPHAVETFVRDIEKNGPQAISRYKQEADSKFAGDPGAHHAANGALNLVQQAQNWLDVTKQAIALAHRGMYDRAGIGLASAAQTLGPDEVSTSAENMGALQYALGKSGFRFSDLLDKNKVSQLASSPLYAGLMQQFGLSKYQGLPILQNLSQDFSGGVLKTLQDGISADEFNNDPAVAKAKKKLYEQVYRELGGASVFGKGDNHVGLVAQYAKQHPDALLKRLSGSETLVEAIRGSATFQQINNRKVTQAQKDKETEDAAKLVANTRTTAEMYADAFTYLFNMLAKPLNEMSRILSFSPWGKSAANVQWASDSDKTIAEQFANTGVIKQWSDARQAKIDNLDRQLSYHPHDKYLQTKLNDAKESYNKFLQTQDTFESGQGVPESDMAAWLADIQENVKGAITTAFSHPKSLADVQQTIGAMDIWDWNTKHTRGLITGEDEKPWDKVLRALQKLGAIKMEKVGKGDVEHTHYIIQITNQNLDFTQHSGNVPGLNKAPHEIPKTPKKVRSSTSSGGG